MTGTLRHPRPELPAVPPCLRPDCRPAPHGHRRRARHVLRPAVRRRRRGNRIVPPRSDAFRAPVRAATLHRVPRMCRPHRGRAIPRRGSAPRDAPRYHRHTRSGVRAGV